MDCKVLLCFAIFTAFVGLVSPCLDCDCLQVQPTQNGAAPTTIQATTRVPSLSSYLRYLRVVRRQRNKFLRQLDAYENNLIRKTSNSLTGAIQTVTGGLTNNGYAASTGCNCGAASGTATGTASGAIKGSVTGVVNTATGVVNGVVGKTTGVVQGLTGGLTNYGSYSPHAYGCNCGAASVSASSTATGTATGAIKGAVTGVVNTATGVVNGVVGKTTGVVQGITGGLTNYGSYSPYTYGCNCGASTGTLKGVGSGIINTATGVTNGLVGKATGAVQGITGGLTNYGPNSPYTYCANCGGSTGILNGVGSGIINTAAGVATGLVGKATGAVQGITGGLQGCPYMYETPRACNCVLRVPGISLTSIQLPQLPSISIPALSSHQCNCSQQGVGQGTLNGTVPIPKKNSTNCIEKAPPVADSTDIDNDMIDDEGPNVFLECEACKKCKKLCAKCKKAQADIAEDDNSDDTSSSSSSEEDYSYD